MRTIRYSKMIVGDSNQYSTLTLSSWESHQCTEVYTTQLADLMLSKSKKWLIEGTEVLDQADGLLDLLRYLKKGGTKSVTVKLRTNHYDYWFMRCTSVTDEILDFCDVLIDRNEKPLDLQATLSKNELIYWKEEEASE